MTPAHVASAIRACRAAANDNGVQPEALLALAGIASEYLAATDAWNAASYVDAELLGAATRLEQADRELRAALGLPAHVPGSDTQTAFAFSTDLAPPEARTTE